MIFILLVNICTELITVKYLSLLVKKRKSGRLFSRRVLCVNVKNIPLAEEKSWIRIHLQKGFICCSIL